MNFLFVILIFILGCDNSTQPPDACGIMNGPGAIYECGCEQMPICGSIPCCSCEGEVEDCAGECGGVAEYDECGICEGSGVDSDNDDICDDMDDCLGEYDECDVCNGPGLNNCGECGEDGFNIEGCLDCLSETLPNICCENVSIPQNSFTILENGNLIYNSDNIISGFQIKLTDSINSISGGITSLTDYNFTISSNGSEFLGFSISAGEIPSGCGMLLNINTNQGFPIVPEFSIWVGPNATPFQLNYVNP